MTLAATGSLTLLIDNTRKLLADSPTFRALMEQATPTLAYGRAFLGYTDDDGVESEASFPRTIVANHHLNQRKTSTTGGVTQGTVRVQIEVLCPTEYLTNDQDAYIWINNKIGTMTDEIWALSWNGSEATLNTGETHPNVIEIEVLQIGKGDPTESNGVQLLGANIALTLVGKI